MTKLVEMTLENLSTEERDAVVTLALEIMAERFKRGEPLASPAATTAYLRLQLGGREREFFGCLFLDNRHRVLAFEELFSGTIDGASVNPRIVVQRALALNAAAVIFTHNHPSGVAEPSMADEAITRRLHDALALVEIRVLDHIIVSASASVSFAERGLV
jgi:DNA repair protein RadC